MHVAYMANIEHFHTPEHVAAAAADALASGTWLESAQARRSHSFLHDVGDGAAERATMATKKMATWPVRPSGSSGLQEDVAKAARGLQEEKGGRGYDGSLRQIRLLDAAGGMRCLLVWVLAGESFA
jgi:hypothetical protein